MGRPAKIVRVVAGAVAAALVGVAAFTMPIGDCAPCRGRRHPALDLEAAARRDVEAQVRVCQACGGRGRLTLLGR